MDPGRRGPKLAAEASLWPLVEDIVRSHGLAGLAVAAVSDGEVVLSRGFGVRNVHTGEPVTPDTMFHLASVSKSFVATAIVELATPRGESGVPFLQLDTPVVEWLPDFTLADGRAGEITARHLLTHTSGIPDVIDFGWQLPQLGDDALHKFVLSLSASSLTRAPGSEFSYCNAGFEVLGHLLSTVTGQTFESAVKRLVLDPVGMQRSTFLRADVPPDLAASPHVGVPLRVPDAYPYSRRHAPSSTLHSSAVELCRWMLANLPAPATARDRDAPRGHLDPAMLERMWQRAATAGGPPWEEAVGMGWFLGTYRGHRTVSHSGADPGFGSKLVLLPDQRTGVVVLANSNTAPTGLLASAMLDVLLKPPADSEEMIAPSATADRSGLGALLPPLVGPLAAALAESGTQTAKDAYHRLTSADPAEVDLDDECFTDAVWGAIELHRSHLVQPILQLWATVRPESAQALAMTGWVHKIEGRPEAARDLLRQALDIDPGNHDATLLLRSLPPSTG